MDLQALVAAVNLDGEEVEVPSTPVGKKDHVVGVMSDYHRRLRNVQSRKIILAKQVINSMIELMKMHDAYHSQKSEAGHSSDECIKFKEEIKKLAKEEGVLQLECRMLEEIFWLTISFDFPELQSKKSVGLRQGNKVVWTEVDETNDKLGLDLLALMQFGALMDSFSDNERKFKES